MPENTRERARRFYRDVVRRRTVVRITTPSEPETFARPAFLVGAYRSGTTLVRLMLDSHPSIAVPPETIFLKHLEELADPASLVGLKNMGFDRSHVLTRVRAFSMYFYENYALSRNKPMWVDKSPEYVWSLGWLKVLFPEARFILLTRFALDQIHSHVGSSHELDSRLAPFMEDENEDIRVRAARYWAASVRAQLEFASQYPDDTLLLRYEDVCSDPRNSLTPALRLLGVDWDERVMKFGKLTHDFGQEDARARASQQIGLSTGAYREWHPEVIRAIHETCAPELTRLGWGTMGSPDGRPIVNPVE